MNKTTTSSNYNILIVIISILIPLAVAALFFVKIPNVKPLSFLPPIYATINGITAIVLVLAVIAIKYGKKEVHERLMKFAILLSCCFLLMYVAYHMTSVSVKYGDSNFNGILEESEKTAVGITRLFYVFILLTHILLSIVIIPLVLFTYVRALSEQFDKHKKLARITFPIWLYVAITGVIVYLMISPYYIK